MRFSGTLTSILIQTGLLAVLGCSRPPPAPEPQHTSARAPEGAPAPASAAPPVAAAAAAPVDVLVLARAPALDATACDNALVRAIADLRSLPGVTHVASAARSGQARVVVRYAAAASAQAATDAVRRVFAATPAFAESTVEAVFPAARARAAEVFVDEKGRAAAADLAEAAALTFHAAVPVATRTSLAGVVRTSLTLLPLAPAMHRNGLSMGTLARQLRDVTPGDAGLPALQAWLKTHPADVSSGRFTLDHFVLAALMQGEPLRDARDGRVAVTAVLADGKPRGDDTAWIRGEIAWRQAQRLPAGASIHSLRLSSAARFELTGTGDATGLLERFQRARMVKDCIGMLAISGRDGIPESLDVDARSGRLWTVWLIAAPADIEAVAVAAQPLLAGAPWRVQRLTNDADPATRWLTAARLPGSAVIAQATAARLGVQAGDLALAARLLEGPLSLGRLAGLPAWLSLPVGDLADDRLRVPLAGPQGSVVPLGDLLEILSDAGEMLIEHGTATAAGAP